MRQLTGGSDARRRITAAAAAAAAIGSAIDDNWAPTDTADDRQCAIKSHSCPVAIVHRDWLSDQGGVHPVVPQMGDGRLVDVLMPPPISADSGTCAGDDGAEWAGGLAHRGSATASIHLGYRSDRAQLPYHTPPEVCLAGHYDRVVIDPRCFVRQEI